MSGNDRDHAGGFRQRLDAVLRQRNPAELRAFLVAEGQWDPEARTDEEAAMWMMIGASPVLADLHAEAERWLMTHGHEHEAQAILGRRRVGAGGTGGTSRARGQGQRPKPGGGTPRQQRSAHGARPSGHTGQHGKRPRKD